MMEKFNAVITGVGGYVPDYVLTNDELSRMVDTNDEWIMTRIGVTINVRHNTAAVWIILQIIDHTIDLSVAPVREK